MNDYRDNLFERQCDDDILYYKFVHCCDSPFIPSRSNVAFISSLHIYVYSSSAANAALNYINYPTRVIFRSCKLVPTIIIAMLLHRKNFQISELMLGVTMSLGMILFAVADFQVSAVSSSYGILLVSFSVLADSILPNYQVEVLNFIYLWEVLAISI